MVAKRRRRLKSIGNNIKEHYREMSNHEYYKIKHKLELQEELTELVERVLKKYPRLTFIGHYGSIHMFNKDSEKRDDLTIKYLVMRCCTTYLEDKLIFTFAGKLTCRQFHELHSLVPFMVLRQSNIKGVDHFRFVCDFKEYFGCYFGDEVIEQYQVRKQ